MRTESRSMGRGGWLQALGWLAIPTCLVPAGLLFLFLGVIGIHPGDQAQGASHMVTSPDPGALPGQTTHDFWLRMTRSSESSRRISWPGMFLQGIGFLAAGSAALAAAKLPRWISYFILAPGVTSSVLAWSQVLGLGFLFPVFIVHIVLIIGLNVAFTYTARRILLPGSVAVAALSLGA